MALIATDGAVDANSYSSISFADAYFETRLGSSAWDSATDPEAALIQATRVLDYNFDWIGYRNTDTQSLAWPRSFAPDPDSRWITLDGQYVDNTVVPTSIREATCEMALFLITNSGYSGEANDLKNIQVGPIKLGYNTMSLSYPIPKTVLEMLREWGEYRGGSSGPGIRTVKVIRT